jgi:hypothetical protein
VYITKTVQQHYTKEDVDLTRVSERSCAQIQLQIAIVPIRASAGQKKRRFRKLVSEAVEESLSTLGEAPKQAIYHHLQESFNIRRQEIPDKTYEFTCAIEKMFGEGAKLLEIQIMKSLHEKTGGAPKLYYRKEELSFTEYLRALREV